MRAKKESVQARKKGKKRETERGRILQEKKRNYEKKKKRGIGQMGSSETGFFSLLKFLFNLPKTFGPTHKVHMKKSIH